MRYKQPRQNGFSVIEVMITLLVLMFAGLSSSNLQNQSLKSLEISKAHFSISGQTQQMIETLKANSRQAKLGELNVAYDDSPNRFMGAEPAQQSIYQWLIQVSEELPQGGAQIDCDSLKCTVSVRWKEYIDGSSEYQYFNIATLI